ncbi:MAG: hypothetical protein V4683_05320 [Bacteroidota bacterium]
MLEEAESLSNAPNSPGLDGKYLGEISTDFALVSDSLKEAAYQIKRRGFSDFPIFAVSKNILPIGSLLIAQMEINDNLWNYYASMLEEFVQREIISIDAIDSFKANYKEIDEFCCLFVMDQSFAGFIHIPYPED